MFSEGFIGDNYLNGNCYDAYRFFGNHRALNAADAGSESGVIFRVYAPEARSVYIAGSFNGWGNEHFPEYVMDRSENGIWEKFVDGICENALYKYKILDRHGNIIFKNDPYAISAELRPGTASVIYELPEFPWHDGQWLEKRSSVNIYDCPVNIYEIHPGSWRRGRIPGIDYESNWQEAEGRKSEEPFLNYRQLADELAPYLSEMNYTHVELMPVCEHPLDGSWGYQTGSYYAVTSRFGTPEDFMYFVDRMHMAGIGVIADWVPGHFCKDGSWLYTFDGSHLYEYDDENKRENPLWGTANFDYSKPFVRNFMISNALYWLKEYHIDGLRTDAVANIIYYDYNRMHKDRPVNRYGGFENEEAISFLKEMNAAVHSLCPGVITVAEDSSTYSGITARVDEGGFGFDFKWNMGWMNDTLKYMSESPEARREDHNKMNFAMMYAHRERFMLSLSHDESVHGKRTLLDKMYGSLEDKFLQYRAYMLFMMCHPGKKLLFMGSEFGQIMEWRYYESLEWKMLLYPQHGLLKDYMKALNGFYLSEKALYSGDHRSGGFRWIDADDRERNTYSFIRSDPDNENDFLIAIFNFSPASYDRFTVGVPRFCDYKIVFRSSEPPEDFGINYSHDGAEGSFKSSGSSGSGGIIRPKARGFKDYIFSIDIEISGYSAVIIKPVFRPGQFSGYQDKKE